MSRSDWQASRPLVVDTNTTLSALIGGATRTLLFELDRDLRYPEPSYVEILRNKGVIQERAGLSPTTVDELIDTVFENITLVPESAILRNYDEAADTTSPHPDADPNRTFEDRDEDDVVFLAAALAAGGDVWSDDGVFKHQDHVSWFETADVVEYADVQL